MHAIIWIIGGLVAGSLTAAAMGQRGHRLLGDVALGLLGAVLMGSLFQRFSRSALSAMAKPCRVLPSNLAR